MKTPEEIDPIDRHVGGEIARRRIAQGSNQSDLGRHLGLTFQQVQKYEKGQNRVSASKLWKAAEFLGCDVQDLFPVRGAVLERPNAGETPFWAIPGAIPLSNAYRLMPAKTRKLFSNLAVSIAAALNGDAAEGEADAEEPSALSA